MRTLRYVARAVGSSRATTRPYRVEVWTGAHQIVADEPAVRGGGEAGPSPFELLLSALVACTTTTLRMYTIHKGWELDTIEVDARYHSADHGQGAIERTITVSADLTPDQRARLADIAERTPVTLALRRGTPITTTFHPA